MMKFQTKLLTKLQKKKIDEITTEKQVEEISNEEKYYKQINKLNESQIKYIDIIY